MARAKESEEKNEQTADLVAEAKDDVCRLICYACRQCINGKTRENPAVMFEGIAALYQAIK